MIAVLCVCVAQRYWLTMRNGKYRYGTAQELPVFGLRVEFCTTGTVFVRILGNFN